MLNCILTIYRMDTSQVCILSLRIIIILLYLFSLFSSNRRQTSHSFYQLILFRLFLDLQTPSNFFQQF